MYRYAIQGPINGGLLAAVLACGEGAVLSGIAAAHLFGLVKGSAPDPEVSNVADRTIEGVITRRVRRLDPRDVARHRGIPVTTVPRTLVDVASILSVDDLARACHEAEVRYRTTPAMVCGSLARRPNTPGAAKLNEIFVGAEMCA